MRRIAGRSRHEASRGAAVALFLISLAGCRSTPSVSKLNPSPAAKAPLTASPASRVDLIALNSLLKAEAARIPGSVSVHVRLEDGGTAGVRAQEPMPAASLIKVPIMVVLEDAWKRGRLKRLSRDEESVRKATTVSDNPSADWLIFRLGQPQINDWLKEHGYTHTHLKHRLEGPRPDGPNVVSAEDMTRMLLEIAEGKLISPEASTEMRSLLLAQTRRTRLPAGLPPDVPIGNKTGTLRGIVNDAAFIEPPGGPRYALAVLVSRAGSDAATSLALARLSRKVYEVVTSSTLRP